MGDGWGKGIGGVGSGGGWAAETAYKIAMSPENASHRPKHA